MYYYGEIKILPYSSKEMPNFATSDDFVGVVMMTNQTRLLIIEFLR